METIEIKIQHKRTGIEIDASDIELAQCIERCTEHGKGRDFILACWRNGNFGHCDWCPFGKEVEE